MKNRKRFSRDMEITGRLGFLRLIGWNVVIKEHDRNFVSILINSNDKAWFVFGQNLISAYGDLRLKTMNFSQIGLSKEETEWLKNV